MSAPSYQAADFAAALQALIRRIHDRIDDMPTRPEVNSLTTICHQAVEEVGRVSILLTDRAENPRAAQRRTSTRSAHA